MNTSPSTHGLLRSHLRRSISLAFMRNEHVLDRTNFHAYHPFDILPHPFNPYFPQDPLLKHQPATSFSTPAFPVLQLIISFAFSPLVLKPSPLYPLPYTAFHLTCQTLKKVRGTWHSKW
uniref:Uncharacterized protein n=1 Tax=Opuntia streptacantha TaxID=393608 RepID=A0A7C9CMG5_OPUST